MKICVYAISKNESKHCKMFMENLKGHADEIIVADTGSTDDTIETLRALGATVHSIRVDPWRFDKALNQALALVPEDTDVCFKLDLDEVPEPNWRKKIEAGFTPEIKMLKVKFIWSYLPNGDPDLAYMHTRVHTRKDFEWVHPVHECLHYSGAASYIEKNSDLIVNHRPDPHKSRAGYMDLLKIGVVENPTSARARFYYATELYFHKRYDEAKAEFKHYLTLSNWSCEKANAMRRLAAISRFTNRRDEELRWLLRAVGEAPNEREAWVELSQHYLDTKNYLGGYFAAKEALKIQERTDFFTEAFAWGSRPYDLAGTCAYYVGLKDEFKTLTTKALELDPTNERLKKNIEIFSDK